MERQIETILIADNEYAAFLQQVRRAIILQLKEEQYLTDQQLTRLLDQRCPKMSTVQGV